MVLIQKITSSLRAKLMTMFVILTCVPLISVGLISYQKSFNTVFTNSKSATMLLADQLARDIDNLFIDTSKLLELEKNPKLLHFLFSQNDTYEDSKDILKTMASYRQTYRYESVLNITMINLYGRGISERKGVFQLDRNPLRNTHFAYLMHHPDDVLHIPSSGVSELERLDGFHYKNHNVISIISTVKQRVTHEVIGFIIIDLDDSIVKRFCDNVTIGKNGFFYVVDESGIPIFKPSQMSDHTKLPNVEELSAILAGPENHYIDASEGKPSFVFASPSKTTGWNIVGQVPLQEIVEEANSIRQLIIISVVLSIIFAFTLHYFVSNRLTRPVNILKKKMQLAASGFLEAKVTPTGTDEIADLGNSFNIMLGKIRMLLDQSIKEQQEMKKSELRALQAQINPHFLYNTLDSILWMAEAGKKEQVIQLVIALSRLFRISLSKGRDWIPIEKELEHLQSYLTIQQIRYRDILDYEIFIDSNLYAFPILKMTLQPIVENALYHGLKNKRSKGMIRIYSYAEENKHIMLNVEDNGIGMSEARLEQLRNGLMEPNLPEITGNEVSGGFGLHNVQRRLRLYYGESYGVQVYSKEGEGTTVTIRIPMKDWSEFH
ncbi:cache domain-containing sensor histidine kinase [Paenibacillus sedimenti]|uniref:histidine kinase n=1 Tax=Paenibacillus sedimenti TaxID=2770274 RepID=A0A926QK99_9BACL|nr:sensor histidine kinase [Paenibacillus sedimenti]MBD0381523.1 sensor histidine kinase [Paenibacillus sedimenti]